MTGERPFAPPPAERCGMEPDWCTSHDESTGNYHFLQHVESAKPTVSTQRTY